MHPLNYCQRCEQPTRHRAPNGAPLCPPCLTLARGVELLICFGHAEDLRADGFKPSTVAAMLPRFDAGDPRPLEWRAQR